jgi:hypothetical protein
MSSILKDADLVSVQEVRSKVEEAHAAWQRYRSFSQERVDGIVEQIAAAARAHARRLAELAVEETGYGNAKDKLAKNLLCADVLPRAMRGMKTVGIVREIPEQKIVEIAVPMGVVAAILPTRRPPRSTKPSFHSKRETASCSARIRAPRTALVKPRLCCNRRRSTRAHRRAWCNAFTTPRSKPPMR